METQTTKQPTCDKEQTKSSWSQKIKRAVLGIVKTVLRYVLLRPATWHWLMVRVPEAFAKLEVWIKEIAKGISELF